MAGFAARHPDEVAGLVLLETPKAITILSLPPEVRAEIACDSPRLEYRADIGVEHEESGTPESRTCHFPMMVVSNDYGPEAPPGDEQTNVVDQRTWLVLSPNSRQVVVTSGHDVVWNESALVTDEILAVLAAVRGSAGDEAAGATIVGPWHRAQSCEEMLAVFEAAGLVRSHLGWLQGNFFGGGPGPTDGDVCEGAQGPLEHDHFFTEGGAFGSHDEIGEQVDDGDYVALDGDTLAFPSHASEFGYERRAQCRLRDHRRRRHLRRGAA